jgi:hypothetical protein
MASPSPAHVALKSEITELVKSRRALEKNAAKTIRGILKSADTPEKKRADRHAVKKEMKEALVSTKKALKEKSRALATIA